MLHAKAETGNAALAQWFQLLQQISRSFCRMCVRYESIEMLEHQTVLAHIRFGN